MSTSEWEKYYTKENIQFSALSENYMAKWGIVLQFQHLAQVGFPSTAEYYTTYVRKSLEKMKPGGEYEGFIIDPDSFFAGDKPDKHAQEITARSIKNALTVSNTASLVFGHSLLDALLNEHIELIVSIDPSVFHEHIRDQKIKCASVINGSHVAALQEKVRKHVSKLKRDSLLDRANVMHQICKPPPGFLSRGLYKYDPNRLRAIDRLRQDILHAPRPVAPEVNQDIDDDLWFLIWLGMYFMALMNHRFDLKIIPLPRKGDS